MMRNRYYTPQLDRDLVTLLYHTARSRRVPMTRLASALVREGLARLEESSATESTIVREDPPAADPGGRD
jgi:hypothetical protein